MMGRTVKEPEYINPEDGPERSGGSFGRRAEVLARLLRLGYPVPRFRVVPFAAARRIGGGAGFDASRMLAEFEASDLLLVRSSPEHPEWGGPKPIANIGMCRRRAELLALEHGEDEAATLHAEFIQTFAMEVVGLDAGFFEELAGSRMPPRDRVQLSLEHFLKETGERFPECPAQQLEMTCRFMARSWEEPSARLLRGALGAPETAGLGLIVQRVASGLVGPQNGSGRATAIDRESGERILGGSYSYREQGGGPHSAGLDELIELSPGSRDDIRVTAGAAAGRVFGRPGDRVFAGGRKCLAD